MPEQQHPSTGELPLPSEQPAKRKPSRKAKEPVAPGAKVHKGPTPKPLKGERSGQFIQRCILKGLWSGTDRSLAELMRKKYFKDQVTTEKDIAWNRWKLRKTRQLKH